MADFDAIAAMADAAIDEILGRTFRIEPQVTGYMGTAPDPSRAVKTITGTFRADPETLRLAGQSGQFSIGLTRIEGRQTVLHLSAAEVAALGYELAKDDRAVLVKTGADVAVYRVAKSVATELGDRFVDLVVE